MPKRAAASPTSSGTTFFVEAAAGTGKTTALVKRIVGAHPRAGAATLDRIASPSPSPKRRPVKRGSICAAKSKRRAPRRLPSNAHGSIFGALREQLELARIGTIHAFCGDLLLERPVEAGIDPLFEVAAEDEAQALLDEAFDGWFEAVLADPPEGIRRLLRRRSERIVPRELLHGAMMRLCEHRDFPTPWRRDVFDRNNKIDALVADLADLPALAAESSQPDDSLTRNLLEIGRFVEEATRLEPVNGRDYDGLEAGLRALRQHRSWRDTGRARATSFGDLTRDEVPLARSASGQD